MSQDKKIDISDSFLRRAFPDADMIFQVSTLPVSDVIDDAIFVLDANTLLLPCGASKEILEKIKSTYEALASKDRLFVPEHAAREFSKIRPNKLKQVHSQLLSLNKEDPISKAYPLLEDYPEYQQLKDLDADIEEKLSKRKKIIKELIKQFRNLSWNDPVSTLYQISLVAKG